MPERNITVIVIATIVGVSCFVTAGSHRYSSVFGYAIDTIEDRSLYHRSKQELFDAAMTGMLKSLDVNSTYFSNEAYESAQESLNQEYVGVGMQVGIDNESQRLIVVAPTPNSPAQQAGVLAGDFIVAVNGKSTVGMTTVDAVGLIKGPEGESVQLTLERPADNQTDQFVKIELDVVRARIHTPSVKGDVFTTEGDWIYRLESQPEIGYIRLTQFVQHSVEEMEEALESIDGDVNGLILDLRGNLGGLLEGAIKISDLFLPPEKLIVEIKGRNGEVREQHFSETDAMLPTHIPLVVLINSDSASASEIVSACLQDHRRAIVVGERSFGKGTVQEIIPLERSRAEMRLTTASYWRPSGQNIHRLPEFRLEDAWGVSPNDGFEIKQTPLEWRNVQIQRANRDIKNLVKPGLTRNLPDIDQSQDAPLKKAIDYLKNLTQGADTQP